MRILQQHLDFIEYEPIEKEISQAEDAEKDKRRYEEIVVLFTSVEKGDDEEVARKAVEGTKDYLARLKVNRIIIYPYAHLSQNLARPKDALEVLKAMERLAKEAGIETFRSPFGWNKAFQIKVKGHPLAEQSRLYSLAGTAPPVAQAPTREAEKVSVDRRQEMTEDQMFSRIKKSDFAGLPESDHRIIGERLDLFSFQEPSPGMVYWHDKGWTLRNTLVDFIRKELRERGYLEISNPALANTMLWRVSGHSDHYRDNMFLTRLGDEEMGLKPMNCPSTFLVYRSRKWSFRDLPVRYAIFDPLYRNELSGVASGLFRVKVLTQDDGHIIATEEQAEREIVGVIDLLAKMYGVFKLEYKVKISTQPDDHMGSEEEWKRATDILINVVKAKGLPYEIKEKEGNFYSPKIDVDIKDSLGREWQCGTIQLDLQMPKRFRLAYTGSDGKEHTPVVIHRAIYGSLERFIGILIEHYQGKFPLWLSPVQLRVLPISDENRAYAESVQKRVREAGECAEADMDSGTIGGKIRNAQMQKIPFSIITGKKEVENGTISVRSRDGIERHDVRLEDFIEEISKSIENYQ